MTQQKQSHPPWVCEECGSHDVSITPVPGLWLQYWCNKCEYWWWEDSTGRKAPPQAEAS